MQGSVDSCVMNIGCQVSKKNVNRLATARLEGEPGVQTEADWLARVARQFRLAMFFQIPEGYEDEAGFHQGAEQAQEINLPASEPHNFLTNQQQF